MSNLNPAPRYVHVGVKDVSFRAQPSVQQLIPTDCPHFYLFTEKGRTLPEFVDANDFNKLFGNRSTDIRSKYFSHSVLAYNIMVAAGNLTMVQRLKPVDANPPAGFSLWLELLEENVPQYQRGPTGVFLKDSNGERIPITSGGSPVTTPGYSGRWVVLPLQRVNSDGDVITQSMIDQYDAGDPDVNIQPVANKIGGLVPRAGTRSNSNGTSTLYPIFEFETDSFGEWGNRAGIRLWAAKTTDATPVDTSLVSDNAAFLYRFQVVYKDDDLTQPVIQETLRGGQYVEFGFKEGAVDRKTDRELFAEHLLTTSYNQDGVPGLAPTIGHFSKHHVYYQHVQSISELIITTEATANSAVVGTVANALLINLLDATDVEGREYFSYYLLGPSDNGVNLNAYRTIYAVGGSDGTMNNTTYDALVNHELKYYGELDAKMFNELRYPVTLYLDTGFKLDTKKQLLSVISKRKDVIALATTFIHGEPPLTAEQEASLATSLSAFARTQPESVEFGTPVVRAGIYGHSGYLLNSKYTKPVPWILDVIKKIAKYMGSGDGFWKQEYAFDNERNNRVDSMYNLTLPYKSRNQRFQDWELGLTTVQNADHKTLFSPGWPSCYPDSTSILNNIIHAFVVAELEKICARTWTKLTYNTQLSDAQFIEKSDKLLAAALNGRFDNRVIVVPETSFTPDDQDRGFSYTCKLTMYGNVAKTVGSYYIVSKRKSDLLNGGNA